MVRTILVCAIAFSLSSVLGAQTVVSSISYGAFGNYNPALQLTEEEKASFQTMRIDTNTELRDLVGKLRALRAITDAATYEKWVAENGALIRQVNYDLWQRARSILKTDERMENFYRALLHDQLHSGSVQQLIAFTGVKLEWSQIEELTKRFADNKRSVHHALAETRREIEARRLEPWLGEIDLDELRGTEMSFQQPLDDDFGPGDVGPFDQLAIDDTPVRLASNPEVLDELKADLDTRRMIQKVQTQYRRRDVGTIVDLLRRGNNGEHELLEQKFAEEAEMIASIRSCFSIKQFKRLQQIACQHKLKNFQYRKFLEGAGIEVADVGRRDLEMKDEHLARQEYQFAVAQTLVDENAKAFDDVAGTSLAPAIGKLIVFVWGTHHIRVMPGQEKQRGPLEMFGPKYGTPASVRLSIPDVLSKPPEKPVAWAVVEIPEGWQLADAMENLKKKTQAAEETVAGYRKWKEEERNLRQEMRLAGNGPEGKALRAKFMKEYGGRARFDLDRNFREAARIVGEDINKARRIVKQLGGDPGEAKDWQHIRMMVR